MDSNAIVAEAISSLATRMRLCSEAHWRYHKLFKVDPEEAIDNVDRAFEAKLEGFHTLYDVSKHLFPYFDHGDTALLIAIRNAIHHRNHPLFKSFRRRLHLEEGGVKRWLGAAFLLVGHPTSHGEPIHMSHHIQLDHLDARLDPRCGSPYFDTSISGPKATDRFVLVDAELGLPAIRQFRDERRYPCDQVYLDLMPIFVSATCKVFKALQAADVAFNGFDARTYQTPFTSELAVDLGHHDFKELRV